MVVILWTAQQLRIISVFVNPILSTLLFFPSSSVSFGLCCDVCPSGSLNVVSVGWSQCCIGWLLFNIAGESLFREMYTVLYIVYIYPN
jgi:hypothetical protein